MAELTITKKNFESEVLNSISRYYLISGLPGAVRAECWLRLSLSLPKIMQVR